MAKEPSRKGRNLIPTFPARLAELRVAAGMSQAQLAGAAGTSPSAVSGLELGTRAASLELAARLADALGVSLDAFRDPPGKATRRRLSPPGRPRKTPATEASEEAMPAGQGEAPAGKKTRKRQGG